MSWSRPEASLAPITTALLSLVSIGLLGLVVALWAEQEPAPRSPSRGSDAAVPAPQSYEGGSYFAPEPRKGPSTKWM